MTKNIKFATMVLGTLMVLPTVSSATELTFSDGYGGAGYQGTHDTEIRPGSSTIRGDNTNLSIDSSNLKQALIKFDDIFGGGAGQIASGSTIDSATLSLQIHSPGNDLEMLQMLVDWDESTALWDTLGGGIQNDGIEATWLRTLTLLDSSSVTDEVTVYTIDVTNELQLWANGTANYGWGFTPTGANGVDFHTSEHTDDGHVRPTLVVSFTAPQGNVPEPATIALIGLGLAGLGFRKKK